jgi:hypothetical protein
MPSNKDTHSHKNTNTHTVLPIATMSRQFFPLAATTTTPPTKPNPSYFQSADSQYTMYGDHDPAEIAEVVGFGRDPETPLHDGVQWWCHLAPMKPFGRPCERGREVERRAVHQGGRRGGTWHFILCPPLSWGLLYIVGRGCTLPVPQATKVGSQREAKGRGRPREVGPSQPPPTLTLALAG